MTDHRKGCSGPVLQITSDETYDFIKVGSTDYHFYVIDGAWDVDYLQLSIDLKERCGIWLLHFCTF